MPPDHASIDPDDWAPFSKALARIEYCCKEFERWTKRYPDRTRPPISQVGCRWDKIPGEEMKPSTSSPNPVARPSDAAEHPRSSLKYNLKTI